MIKVIALSRMSGLCFVLLAGSPLLAQDAKSAESLVCSTYVPAYSHVYLSKQGKVLLAVNLSIRNIDPNNAVRIEQASYFDTDGNLLEELVDEPRSLPPMATVSFVIEQTDTRGGAGANFVVEWSVAADARRPMMEAIMAGYSGTKGLAFVSRGIDTSQCTGGRGEPGGTR